MANVTIGTFEEDEAWCVSSIDSKLPDVGTTIFTVMSRLAERHGAINLSQGFPEFQPPARLVELVAAALRAGHNQYAPMSGLPSLCEAIAGKLETSYGVRVDPAADITVTAGATEALFAAIHCIVRPGDEVIVFDPAYDSYGPAVTLAGGRTIHVPLVPPEFSIDWDRLHDALSDATRLLILNTPHNPSGAMLSRDDLDRLAALLRPWGTYVLSDEVYEHVVFDGRKHVTVLAQPELAERSFAISSFGKTYHATGWKLGYCVASRELTEEFRRVHQYLVFAANTPLQHGIANFMNECPEHHEQLPEFYERKRDEFLGLIEPGRFVCRAARGTYFQLADYSQISDVDDVTFARKLTEEHGVAAIPISVFYAEPPRDSRFVRFCFAKESETLAKAAERLVVL